MLNLVELGSYHLPLIHFVPTMRFVLLSVETRGFDRKEDFRSSFKEDKKPNEAQKKCRKQAEEAHGRAAVSGATHDRMHSRASDRAYWHSRAVPPSCARPVFPSAI